MQSTSSFVTSLPPEDDQSWPINVVALVVLIIKTDTNENNCVDVRTESETWVLLITLLGRNT
jgi:hypothetical protein